MAPSKESEILAELFRTFSKAFPKDGDPYLTRCVYDQVSTVATEVPGTTYESITAGGRPGLWISPRNASKDHVVLFMHGGGFSFGSTNGHRKTPEHAFPVPLDDCVAAYKWLLDKGYAPNRIVVAGDSCGGGLSATVPLAAVERGLPNPGAAVSLSPWYDATYTHGESYTTNQSVDLINTIEGNIANADKYVAGGTSKEHPLVSPIFADLKGLPPTWISVTGCDMLRDQGVLFAEKAREAGVDVVLEVHEGMQHVMEFMAGRAPEADESLRRIGEWVQQKIGS